MTQSKLIRTIAWAMQFLLIAALLVWPVPIQADQAQYFYDNLGRLTAVIDGQGNVAVYTSRAAEKLREEQLAVTVLTVFLTTNPFKDEPQYSNAVTIKLPVATDATPELLRSALRGVERIYREGYRYNKAGVMLTALVPASQRQLDLYEDRDRERSSRLMRVLDRINVEMGAGTLRYAAEGYVKRWRARFERRSLVNTTNWRDLPVAKAS
jgi:DNA polymerase V